MSFRDDHEAAVQRAAALERELAEAKASLENKDRELAAARNDLAEAKDDLSEAKADDRASTAAAAIAADDRAAARERLDALKRDALRRRDERRVAARESEERRDRIERVRTTWADRHRLLVSIAWAGQFVVFPWFLLFPAPLLAVYFGTILYRHTGAGAWSYLIAGLGPPVGIGLAGFLYCSIKLAMMRRWAASRPYEMRGYPDLLRIKPRSRDTDHRDGHVTLRVTLCFMAEPPADLDSILHSFDAELGARGGGRWERTSPIEKLHSKHGSRRNNADTNFETHRWVRRLDRKVLRELHEVSPLESVTFTLS